MPHVLLPHRRKPSRTASVHHGLEVWITPLVHLETIFDRYRLDGGILRPRIPGVDQHQVPAVRRDRPGKFRHVLRQAALYRLSRRKHAGCQRVVLLAPGRRKSRDTDSGGEQKTDTGNRERTSRQSRLFLRPRRCVRLLCTAISACTIKTPRYDWISLS